MQYCDLPHLPGRKPFGGQILSHDFVEAALMLKENWQVWFAYDLEGSYEEAPQDMIDNAQRDRRWCQGNLQHGLVLFAKGLRGVSRIHLMLGNLRLSGQPAVAAVPADVQLDALVSRNTPGLSEITVAAFTPFLQTERHGARLPDLRHLHGRAVPAQGARAGGPGPRSGNGAEAFGGCAQAPRSARWPKPLFSALHAPLQMLWHSQFVATILLGIGVHWGPQKRTADGIDLVAAAPRALGPHPHRPGLGRCRCGAWITPSFWWFAPVLAGMVLSIPLSVLTSRSRVGALTQDWGLFLTPEEVDPPPELTELRERLRLLDESGEGAPHPPNSGLTDAVLDPYANAIHVSLLREAMLNPVQAERVRQFGAGQSTVQELAKRALGEGPTALNIQEQLQLMNDPDAMSRLHRQIWVLPAEKLAPAWQAAMHRLAR